MFGRLDHWGSIRGILAVQNFYADQTTAKESVRICAILVGRNFCAN
jgi:hypothetical protein